MIIIRIVLGRGCERDSLINGNTGTTGYYLLSLTEYDTDLH
jgi:hypothetical protein